MQRNNASTSANRNAFAARDVASFEAKVSVARGRSDTDELILATPRTGPLDSPTQRDADPGEVTFDGRPVDYTYAAALVESNEVLIDWYGVSESWELDSGAGSVDMNGPFVDDMLVLVTGARRDGDTMEFFVRLLVGPSQRPINDDGIGLYGGLVQKAVLHVNRSIVYGRPTDLDPRFDEAAETTDGIQALYEIEMSRQETAARALATRGALPGPRFQSPVRTMGRGESGATFRSGFAWRLRIGTTVNAGQGLVTADASIVVLHYADAPTRFPYFSDYSNGSFYQLDIPSGSMQVSFRLTCGSKADAVSTASRQMWLAVIEDVLAHESFWTATLRENVGMMLAASEVAARMEKAWMIAKCVVQGEIDVDPPREDIPEFEDL